MSDDKIAFGLIIIALHWQKRSIEDKKGKFWNFPKGLKVDSSKLICACKCNWRLKHLLSSFNALRRNVE